MIATILLAAAIQAQLAQAQAGPPRCGGGEIYDVAVPGAPISAIATPDEQTVFVSLNSSNPTQVNGIAILRCDDRRYRFERTIPLESQPAIAALTGDGKTLVVPDDAFIALLDVERAVNGTADPIAGFVEDVPGDDGGAIYAAIAPDDRYAFVAEEQTGTLTTLDVAKARAPGAGRDAIVSEVLIGNAPVGLVLSKDRKYLFATVQVALRRFGYSPTCRPEGGGAGEKTAPGAIVTLDVAKTISDPAHAIVSNVAAGCHPVRAALSPDGATLWVTARGDDAVLAFSTAKLVAGAPGAQIGRIAVGTAPVPVVVTPDGRYVLAGNSNRFATGAGNQAITVIDPATRRVVGQIPAGAFPRQFAMTRSGSTIFLCNYGSNSVTVIDPTAIAGAIRASK
jgi:DNA-binding beta-propeller fold protein YncE